MLMGGPSSTSETDLLCLSEVSRPLSLMTISGLGSCGSNVALWTSKLALQSRVEETRRHLAERASFLANKQHFLFRG
jgi:hypothetical protein